jgi:mono/diheme cytochrome c family protein
LTEIPEHLLKRSKAAKSGKTGDGGGDAGGSAASSAPVAAEASTPAAAGPSPDLPNLDPPAPPPKPVPHFVQAALSRGKIPVWVLPVIAALPIWAMSFAGTMQQPETEDVLLIDAELVYGSCAGCHGGNGGGGVGYALNEGEVLATFPEAIDHMVHVARGSDPIAGEQYGDPDRPGGAHVSGARGRGPMPAQLNSLSMIELEIVVFHERAILSGEDTSSPAYQEWIEHMRETIESEGLDGEEIDLDFLLACANPDYTPGATGEGSPDPEDRPCPGPHGEGGEEA